MIPAWLQNVAAPPCSCCTSGGRNESFSERTLAAITYVLKELFVSEESARRPGLLQRLDPRFKLAALLVAIVWTTGTHHIKTLVALYGTSLLLAALSRLRLPVLLARTWLFVPFFTLIMVLPALFNFMTPGDTLWAITPHIAITRQGVTAAALMVLRVGTAASWTLLLILTTRWSRLFQTLRTLGVPSSFILTLTMMVRYLYVLVREAEEMHLAIQSRTLHHPPTRLGQRMATTSLAVLFAKSSRWVEEIYQAMLARGYTDGL